MKVFGLVLLVAAAQSAKLPSLRQQIAGPNSPILLDNTAQLSNAQSNVTVACNGGEATLTITRGSRAGEVEIRVGSVGGPAGCTLTRSPIAAGASLSTNPAGAACGRVGNPTSYQWNVAVTEWFNGGISAPYGPYVATFLVVCANTPEQPTEQPVATEPPAINEGLAQFTGEVTFTLESAASDNARVWALQLRPVSVAALRGQSYQIDDLVASAGDNSATLIQDGCIVDVDGVRVIQGTAEDQLTTIRITAFQFVDAPGAEISFTATVTLCTPATPGGICEPVNDAATCAAPPATTEAPAPTVAPVEDTTTEAAEVPTDAAEETTVEVVVDDTTPETVVVPEETRTRKGQAKIVRLPETRRPRRGAIFPSLGRLTVKTI